MGRNSYTPEEDALWQRISELQGRTFQTAKHLDFDFEVRNNEMFVSRKGKSITRATVNVAWRNALAMDGVVTGPKQLKTFGASYLYPIFRHLGIVQAVGQMEMDLSQAKEERK